MRYIYEVEVSYQFREAAGSFDKAMKRAQELVKRFPGSWITIYRKKPCTGDWQQLWEHKPAGDFVQEAR